jgi:hypothetical protein
MPFMRPTSEEIYYLRDFLAAWQHEIHEHGALLRFFDRVLLEKMIVIENNLADVVRTRVLTLLNYPWIKMAREMWVHEIKIWAPWQQLFGKAQTYHRNQARIVFLGDVLGRFEQLQK